MKTFTLCHPPCNKKRTQRTVVLIILSVQEPYSNTNMYLPGAGSSQREGVLTIRNVDESARGRYQCTITIAAGVSGSGFVDLQVSSSSTISMNLQDLFIHTQKKKKLERKFMSGFVETVSTIVKWINNIILNWRTEPNKTENVDRIISLLSVE